MCIHLFEVFYLFIFDSFIPYLAPSSFFKVASRSQLSMFHEFHEPMMHTIDVIDKLSSFDTTHNLVQNSLVVAEETLSQYQKVDKTGVIGFIADIIEKAIDLGHVTLQSVGVKYTYGFSICIFTLLSTFFLRPFHLVLYTLTISV